MACYAGETIDISRTVTWHALESVWDDFSGQSPLLQLCREINTREAQFDIVPTAWSYIGASPIDTALDTGMVYSAGLNGDLARQVLFVEMFDAIIAILDKGVAWVDDDCKRWKLTYAAIIKSVFLGGVGASEPTRLANAKLRCKAKALLEQIQDTLDSIDELKSDPWASASFYIAPSIGIVPNSRTGYTESYSTSGLVTRGGSPAYWFEFWDGAGGNSFLGVDTPHDHYEVPALDGGDWATPAVNPSASPGADYFGAGKPLCAGHAFALGTASGLIDGSDSYGFGFTLSADRTTWLNSFQMGWYCINECQLDVSCDAPALTSESFAADFPAIELAVVIEQYESATSKIGAPKNIVADFSYTSRSWEFTPTTNDMPTTGSDISTMSAVSTDLYTGALDDGAFDDNFAIASYKATFTLTVGATSYGDIALSPEFGTGTTSWTIDCCVDACGNYHLEA